MRRISPLYLPYISPISPISLPEVAQPSFREDVEVPTLTLTLTLTLSPNPHPVTTNLNPKPEARSPNLHRCARAQAGVCLRSTRCPLATPWGPKRRPS